MEQAQSSAPPLQAPGPVDGELKTSVVDTPASVVATSHQEKSKAPEVDVPAPVVPATHGEEPDAPRADTPRTGLGPNEHDDVEIVCASPT